MSDRKRVETFYAHPGAVVVKKHGDRLPPLSGEERSARVGDQLKSAALQ